MQNAPALHLERNAQSLAHWLVEGLRRSGAIAYRDRAEMFLMPRTQPDEREAILSAIFT